jgi:DNA-binding NarL/FixJ family response regulator
VHDEAVEADVERDLAEPESAEDRLERVYRDQGDRLWRAVFLACGSREVADDAVAEAFAQALRRGGAGGAPPPRDAATGREALTVRESQVAGLAAQGMSNREIAEALFVTVKTVEWHLKHSYRKLGVGSRRELGAALLSD